MSIWRIRWCRKKEERIDEEEQLLGQVRLMSVISVAVDKPQGTARPRFNIIYPVGS